MTYAEKLKDPRWQKKRLLVMDRDNWTCRGCGSDIDNLHVHHMRYYKDPWDAPDHDLITFCHSCHESVEYSISTIKDNLVEIQRKWGVSGIDEIERIITQLIILTPREMLSVRKMIVCQPDYHVLLKLFRHG